MRCSAESEEMECLPLHSFLGCAAAFFLKIFVFSGAFAKYLENKSVQILRNVLLMYSHMGIIRLRKYLKGGALYGNKISESLCSH